MAKRETKIEFMRMVRAANRAGVDTESWVLQPGSPSNGIQWSLMATGPHGGRYSLVGVPFGGHIGGTAKEAEHFLTGMAAAFESVAYATRREGEQ